nr:MAG TPA: hypothetical protein [Bacteriophage sp.]
MALYPYSFTAQDMLQQGARGEMFINDGIPGHRNDGQRINRTNNQLNLNDHDVLNTKYGLDPRLPSLYRYGFAYGYNQFVIPKGRLVAADPYLMVLDTDTMHYHNAVTIANGGKAVRLAQDKDFQTGGVLANCKDQAQFLVGRIWVPLEDADVEKLKETDEFLSKSGGYVGVGETVRKDVRPANVPLGVLERNEYTRDKDAFNGIMFGPIRTDCSIQLPWFVDDAKAKKNPWGSVVGNVKPGDLVCSDENGRFVMSPLNKRHPNYAATVADMGQYEIARQQVVGQVVETDMSLLPEGAARFAQWALDDRLNFKDFNPYMWPTTNRTGEDFVENPPTLYQSDFRYPGYPYDRTAMTNDLHMLASTREGLYNPRFDEQHRLDRGIPGLLDGYNAVIKAYGSDKKETDTALDGNPLLTVSHISLIADENVINDADRREILITLPDTNLELAKVQIGDEVAVVIPNEIINVGMTPIDAGKFKIVYVDLHKGVIAIRQNEKADEAKQNVPVKVSYVKRGEAGVPTNLDWDGCQGTVRILMNR